MYEFKLGLRAGDAPSHTRYKAFAKGKRGVPSLNVITRHGGLASLLTELAQPDWGEQAVAIEREPEQQAASEPATIAKRKPARRNPERRMMFLTMLRDQGPLPSRDLCDDLGVGRQSVWNLGTELKERSRRDNRGRPAVAKPALQAD